MWCDTDAKLLQDYFEHNLTTKNRIQVFVDFLLTTEKSLVSFPFADERFQAEQGKGFPLKPAVQR
jgi:hypothetical protein